VALTGFVLRVLLACVFTAAGALKLFSTGRTAEAAREFGIPRRLAPVIATLLPPIELVTAVLVLGDATASAGAVVACGLFGSFVAVTAIAVARGRSVSCHCFGVLSASSITGRTVFRNLALLVSAVAAAAITWSAADPIGIGYGRLSGMQWALVALSITVVGMAVLFWRTTAMLLEQHGRVLLRLDALEAGRLGHVNEPAVSAHRGGLAPGAAAPAFDLAALEGGSVSLERALASARPILVVFSDPHCGPCREVLPAIGHWQQEHAAALTTVVIGAGSVAENVAKVQEFGLQTVLLDTDRSVAAAYQSPGTPSAVLVGSDGLVIDSAAGAPGIRQLAATVLGEQAAVGHGGGLVGRAVPSFTLPDLDGRPVSETYFANRDATVVLFWNPDCGFCQRMHPQLHQWQVQRADSAMPMLIVASGRPESLRGLEPLGCPVVRDDGTLTSRFGATGTPMALLVDVEGVIRSEFAAGEQAVFELLEPLARAERPTLPIFAGGAR
jgi:thiol-disulfide isomerase/thioredoxin